MSCLCKDAFLLRVIFVSCGDRLLCTVHQVVPGGSGSSLEKECTFFFQRPSFFVGVYVCTAVFKLSKT